LVLGAITEGEGSVQLNFLYSPHFYTENIIYFCYKIRYLKEEVNCTEPSSAESVP